MLRFGFRRAADILVRCALAFSILSPVAPALAAEQDAECKYHIDLEYQLNMPIYHWAPAGAPKGVILALHGLVMHGYSFDELGKNLADQGFLVYAADMRGYGRLTKEYPHEFCSAKDCKQKVNYRKSSEDLISLADRLKSDHKGLPLYMVGESMGADMAIRIASARPELADGLVLSAPAIRAHSFIDSNTVKKLPVMMANFKQQLDIMPYVKKYASEDPKIVRELTNDPLLRRHMSPEELYRSRLCINKTLSYVPNISADKPVLVLQAKDDKCVRADAIVLLMSRLKSQDQQVRWFEDRGHILIETAHIRPDTMETIVSWLNQHQGSRASLQARAADELITEDLVKSTAD
ncbi:MAG: lysophospholipase [Candidatus Obscuribacterales bacterium]|nr:lysophospholipase [Candidatus Obscuribacterales bacterium]